MKSNAINSAQLIMNTVNKEGFFIANRINNFINDFPVAGPPLYEGLGSRLNQQNRIFFGETLKRMDNSLFINEEEKYFLLNNIGKFLSNDKNIIRNYFEFDYTLRTILSNCNDNELISYVEEITTDRNILDKFKCMIMLREYEEKTSFSLNCIDNDIVIQIKTFYQKFLKFIDDVKNVEENYQNITSFITESINSQSFLVVVLSTINDISLNHMRCENFWSKIEKILNFIIETNMFKSLEEIEVFYIFKNNKRLLLFLFNTTILDKNQYLDWINKQEKSFSDYFIIDNYIQKHKDERTKEKNEEIFKKLVEKGENENEICNLIRDDNIKEFEIYIEKYNISIDYTIESSVFETNEMLSHDDLTLIEYAAFFGSIKIFNYLHQSGAKIFNSIWEYAIHGDNPEVIQTIEELKIIPKNITKYLPIAIKCHSNCYNYINDKYNQEKNSDFYNELMQIFLIYHNFSEFPETISTNSYLFFSILCECNYCIFIESMMKTSKVDFGLNEFLVYFALNFGDKCVIELVLYLIKDEMLGVSIDDELKNKEEDIETNENELNENKNLIWKMNKNLKEAEEEFIKTENNLKKTKEDLITANTIF